MRATEKVSKEELRPAATVPDKRMLFSNKFSSAGANGGRKPDNLLLLRMSVCIEGANGPMVPEKRFRDKSLVWQKMITSGVSAGQETYIRINGNGTSEFLRALFQSEGSVPERAFAYPVLPPA